MKTLILLFALGLFHGSSAASENGLLDTIAARLPSLTRPGPTAAPATAVRGVPEDRIDKSYLLAQCGSSSLLGYADTEAQVAEAVATWRKLLSGAGIKAGAATYDHGMWILPYETPDGSALREFTADPRQFKPKDEQSLRANEAMILGALAERNVRVLASYVVDIPELLPTYSIYYLAKAAARPEDERRVRVLKPGSDIDFDLLRKAGVDILQEPDSWIMVYIGREVGFVTRLAATLEEAQNKLRERTDWLVSQGKTMIGSRIVELTPAEDGWRYVVDLYFYQ